MALIGALGHACDDALRSGHVPILVVLSLAALIVSAAAWLRLHHDPPKIVAHRRCRGHRRGVDGGNGRFGGRHHRCLCADDARRFAILLFAVTTLTQANEDALLDD